MNSLQFIIKFRAEAHFDKMAFPNELTRRSEKILKLTKIIYLVGPSDNRWEVSLSKNGNQLYLEAGWNEFIRDHHVMEDDHLVFKYCGNSCFSVLIFDKSGCERAASYFIKKGRVSSPTKIMQAQKKCIYNSSELNDCALTDVGQFDDTQGSSDDGSFSDDSLGSSSKTEELCIDPEAYKFHSFMKEEEMMKDMMKNGSQVGIRALRFAKSVTKGNPWFLKVLEESSIRNRSALVIPEEFVLCCKLFNPQIITIQIPRKKEWLVEYTRVGLSWILSWKNFVNDNSLKEGDACIFELTVSSPKMVMVVHIFRS